MKIQEQQVLEELEEEEMLVHQELQIQEEMVEMEHH